MAAPPASCEELARIARGLCERIEHGPQQLYRLVGVGLSNFQIDIETEAPLFS
jgi:DNA polymerase-4